MIAFVKIDVNSIMIIIGYYNEVSCSELVAVGLYPFSMTLSVSPGSMTLSVLHFAMTFNKQ